MGGPAGEPVPRAPPAWDVMRSQAGAPAPHSPAALRRDPRSDALHRSWLPLGVDIAGVLPSRHALTVPLRRLPSGRLEGAAGQVLSSHIPPERGRREGTARHLRPSHQVTLARGHPKLPWGLLVFRNPQLRNQDGAEQSSKAVAGQK